MFRVEYKYSDPCEEIIWTGRLMRCSCSVTCPPGAMSPYRLVCQSEPTVRLIGRAQDCFLSKVVPCEEKPDFLRKNMKYFTCKP